MALDAKDLRHSLLDRKIDAVKDAISRARATWLFATLFTFVVATALFNGTASWNSRQLERRALIAAEAGGELEDVKAKIAKGDSTLSKQLEGELAYLRILLPPDATKENLNTFRKAAAQELRDHIDRGVAFDTVQVPLIGLGVTATDVGIVGGLGLAVIGYWLVIALRAEEHAFGEFIHRLSAKQFSTGPFGYSSDENEYAFSAIRHYMIFGVSTRGSKVNAVTFVCFLIPPVLMFSNHVSTILMLRARPDAGRYMEPHVLAELVVTGLVLAVWFLALWYQTRTVLALQAWRLAIEQKCFEAPIDVPPGPARRLLTRMTPGRTKP